MGSLTLTIFCMVVVAQWTSINCVCNGDWFLVGTQCFRPVLYSSNWSRARADCVSLAKQAVGAGAGGDLAHPKNLVGLINVLKNDRRIAQGAFMWLGGSDLFKENTWVWTDGDDISSSSSTPNNWGPNQPNNARDIVGEDCLALKYGNSLNDNSFYDKICSNEYDFICERKKM